MSNPAGAVVLDEKKDLLNGSSLYTIQSRTKVGPLYIRYTNQKINNENIEHSGLHFKNRIKNFHFRNAKVLILGNGNVIFDPYFVNWSIKARGHAFSSGGRACDLCLTEKLIILTADQNTMLNRRDELLESCRH